MSAEVFPAVPPLSLTWEEVVKPTVQTNCQQIRAPDEEWLWAEDAYIKGTSYPL